MWKACEWASERFRDLRAGFLLLVVGVGALVVCADVAAADTIRIDFEAKAKTSTSAIGDWSGVGTISGWFSYDTDMSINSGSVAGSFARYREATGGAVQIDWSVDIGSSTYGRTSGFGSFNTLSTSKNSTAGSDVDYFDIVATQVGSIGMIVTFKDRSGGAFAGTDNLFPTEFDLSDYEDFGDSADIVFYDWSASDTTRFTGQFTSVKASVVGAQPVPEPGTLTLMGLGALGLGFARRRRSRGE